MNSKEQEVKTIEDISLLYELSLAAGQSQNYLENCVSFLTRLMSRKNFIYSSIWIKDKYLTGKHDKNATSVCAFPEFYHKIKNISTDHPLFTSIEGLDYYIVASGKEAFQDLISEKAAGAGVFVLYPLVDIGVLMLIARKTGSPLDYEMNQLKNVVAKFAVIIKGCLSFDLISTEIAWRKEAERKLKEKQKQLKFILESQTNLIAGSIADGVITTDVQGNVASINHAAEEIIACSKGTVRNNPLARMFRILADDMSVCADPLGELLAQDKSKNSLVQRVLIDPDGKRKIIEAKAAQIRGNRGSINGHVIVFRDITERVKAEEKLRESEARWQFALEGSGDGVWDWNLKTGEVYYSRQWKEMLGYADHEIGSTIDEWKKRIHPEDRIYCYGELKKHFRGETSVYQNEHRILCKDGTYKWVLDRGKVIERLADGKPLRVIGTHTDITDRKRYEQHLEYLSMRDQLTALYNRAFFEEELKRLSSSREHPITIISIDIDGLKLINDTLGHERGDDLLRVCATVLKQSLREYDILARVGGDEFGAILPRTDEKTGQEIADRVRANAQLYNNEHSDLHLSISMGAATAKTKDEPLLEAFKKSDKLMYREKLQHSASARSQIIDTLMATLAERDFMTGGHAQRLGELCLALGEKLGLSSRQLNDLALLAQVHDLGKVGIPDAILFKNGPLSDQEWEIMRQHSEKGYRIASSSPDLSGVADLILKHHERWDGKGYPLGLKGEDIPIECRVLAVVDAFDAMISDRPYRRAKSVEEALGELKRCSGSQFDPALVEQFLSIL